MADVIVIGSGPAGSSAATVIARAGYDVLLIEKDEYPGKSNVCGGGMSEITATKLHLPEHIVEKRIPSEIIYFPWGVYEHNLPHVNVLRNKFDRYLAERAVESGSKLLLSTRITDVKRADGGIKVNFSNKDKTPISANLIIFADGPHTLANKFGIGFKRNKKNTALGIVTEIEWKDNPFENHEIFYDKNISNWGYGWIFPNRDLLNIGIGSLISRVGRNFNDTMNYFMKCPVVSDKIHGRKIISKKAAVIPMASAKEIYDQSILVVGDAAGMVHPQSGAGIENAIVGGEIAGKVAVEALEENDFSKLFLSRYKREWEKTRNYASIKHWSTLAKFLLPLSNIDPYIVPKYKNLNYSMDLQKKLKIMLYPFVKS